MTSHEIALLRLHNQSLWSQPGTEPGALLQRLAAVQAQEFAYAKWSIGQRTSGATHASIQQAYARGAILRTHLLRPTWHFVHPADIRWLIDLTAPRIRLLNGFTQREHGIEEAMLRRSNAILGQALAGGHHLPRTELSARLAAAGLPSTGVPLAYLVMHAELSKLVCSGAMRGKQHTYALMDEWVPAAAALTRDEALAELARRYFTTRGPATVRDFATWSSLTLAEARRGLQAVEHGLERFQADGRAYWLAPADPRPKVRTPRFDLVQCYDEYIMSYSESRDVLGLGALDRPEFVHFILLDGHRIGRWRHQLSNGGAEVMTSTDRALTSREAAALQSAIRRYQRFHQAGG
ncbi:winged helix DNA-binding domain-containing protein [Paludibaculum fermentans]|uniref:winged helix DNA-binding domain-containing protein n=1 Tax=Paludibaculum fermentans TaxID=1473598 RepID=UPI003EBF3D74